MLVRPLDGVRVVELSMWIAGPLAGMLLGDLGADVVKVESPSAPDPGRSLPVAHGLPVVTEDGRYMCWESFNRNKRTIAVDLKHPEGRRLMHRLVEQAEIFVTNLRASVRARYEVDFESLTAVNPRLVYASCEGLGVVGPRAQDPVQDTIGMAYSGFMHTVGIHGTPHYPPGSASDVMTGTMTAFGVLAALRQRDATGEAQRVSSSQVQSMLWLQSYNASTAATLGRTFDGDRDPSPFIAIYRCADERWLALGLLRPATQWPALCRILGRPEVAEDPRFIDDSAREANRDQLRSFLEQALLELPRDEWITRMRAADVWCGPVHTVPEAVVDEHVVAEGYVATLDNGIRMVRAPFELTEIPLKGASPYAADTDEVLLQAGCDPVEITALRDAGVIL